jgi:transglutaminase-like putative cysteine protease
MQLNIHHETIYRYEQMQTYSIQLVRLFPASGPTQTVMDWAVSAPGIKSPSVDAYGNLVQQISLSGAHAHIRVIAHGRVQTLAANAPGVVLPNLSAADPWIFRQTTPLTESDTALADFAARALPRGLQSRDDALQLAAAVCGQVSYLTGSTDVAFSAKEAFALGRGVCQDHAHIALALCRALGVPARYVSGYFHTDSEHHLATHAWVDVALPDATGQLFWWPLDVTHQCAQDERHVRLAVGRDYASASPIRGVRVGHGEEQMDAKVIVGSAAVRAAEQQ